MRAPRASLTPIAREFQPLPLDTSALDGSVHRRWLLTTCIVGAAATLLISGIMLGLFGHNAAPPDAVAAANSGETVTTKPKLTQSANLQTASAPAAKTEVIPERELAGDWAYPEISEDELPYSSDDTAVLDAEIEAVENERENITEISKTAPPEPIDETFRLAKGSTLVRELTNRGVAKAAAEELARAIYSVVPQKEIKAGTEFEVTFDRQIDFYGREVIFPVELTFKPNAHQSVAVLADEDGNFDASISGKKPEAIAEKPAKEEPKLEPKKPTVAHVEHFRTKSRVGSSLYATAKDEKIPDYIVAEFTRVFSYDVDFQNQIEGKDQFELFYGKPLSGSSSKRKVMHYAKLNFDGKSKSYFRFTSADGHTDYYDEFGRSASRSLLKTPISGAKLTSRFGMRRHPLLGYSKMHTGVDFGAPTGTPIRAAGSGIVDLAGRHGAYGNTIVIKHGEKYKTLYAHMSRLAAGIRKGTRVNQGQVIGYVGSTGRASGPHLHYEVRVNNRPVNPTAIKAAGGRQLAGSDLQNFRIMKSRILAMMQQAPSATQVAQAGQ